ncbi:MAG: DUF4136 domain-containing protein [Candidatus Zixiibacteriota bacterium]
MLNDLINMEKRLLPLIPLLILMGCRPSGNVQRVSEAGYDFGELSAYTITGGDTDAASLTGFEHDKFHVLFVRSAREFLNARGFREVNPDDAEAPQEADIVMRYTLRETLIITIMDAETRRLIWRGESAAEFTGADLNQESIDGFVRKILSGFPG